MSLFNQCRFVSPKLEQQLKRHEFKPHIDNQQCLVYEFKCNLCDAGYVGYAHGHLHERVEGHTRKSSSIYKHYNLEQNSEMPERFIEQFQIITKCSSKLDCLVKEMLYIRMRKPTLNVQTDSIHAKVFVKAIYCNLCFLIFDPETSSNKSFLFFSNFGVSFCELET